MTRLDWYRTAACLQQHPPAIHARTSPAGPPDPQRCWRFETRKIKLSAGLVFARFRIGARLGAAMHEACQIRFVSETAAITRNERQETVSTWRQCALHLQSTYQRVERNPGVVITRQSLSRKLDCVAQKTTAWRLNFGKIYRASGDDSSRQGTRLQADGAAWLSPIEDSLARTD